MGSRITTSKGPRRVVLIVDSDASRRAALASVLAEGGFRTSFATTPTDAVRRFYEHPSDTVVLLNWDMSASAREKIALIDALPKGTRITMTSRHATVAKLAEGLGAAFVPFGFASQSFDEVLRTR